MTFVNLKQWIEHPETLNKDSLYELRNLLARYPYFQSARLLYLKNLYILHDISFGTELRRAVLYITDRRQLFYLIEGEGFLSESTSDKTSLLSESKEDISVDRTLTLIDAFLSTVPEEMTGHEGLDYSTDYMSYLLEENDNDTTVDEATVEKPKLKGHELIDDFIEKSETESGLYLKPLRDDKGQRDITPEELELEEEAAGKEDDDESCFTETLAKIYVKQQRYSKALEIIKKLSLKYPKKNAYFADQIRFLEKLIINANSK